MSQSALQFEFSEPFEPMVLSAARQLADLLASGTVLTRKIIGDTLSEHFGGSDADGRWSVTEARAALELAQVLWLMGKLEPTVTTPPDIADQAFADLEARIPTQANRSEEQVELQQFATPPRLAWLAARACARPKMIACSSLRPAPACWRSGPGELVQRSISTRFPHCADHALLRCFRKHW